jgi:hypothetical protein
MGLFLKKLILALLIGLGISIVLDLVISNALLKSNYFAHGESFIWNEIRKGNIQDDLLIYGSSRAMTNFDPQIIEDSLRISTYNLGVDGHNFWLQYLRHKKFLNYNRKPKVIILSVGIFSLSKRKDLYNHYQFLPFMYDKDFFDYTSSYDGFSIFDYSIPLYRYIGKQDSIMKAFKGLKKERRMAPYRIKGFRAMNRVWNQDLANAKLKMGSFKSVIHEPSERLIQQFIDECYDLGIKVVIVYSPEQIQGQFFVRNRNEIISTYNYLSQKNDLTFIDYSYDIMCKDTSYFYNSMHLNSKGANLFTKKLVSDLLKLKILN